MKYIYTLISTLTLFLFGCSTTTITKTTYGEDGTTVASVEVTETSSSPLVVGLNNLENKHVLLAMSNWSATVGFEPSSNLYGAGIESLDMVYASIVATQGDEALDSSDSTEIFEKIIKANNLDLSITSDGMSSNEASTSSSEEEAEDVEEAETTESDIGE